MGRLRPLKRANIIFTYEPARRLTGTGVTVNAVHPGGVRTGFAKNNGPLVRALMTALGPFQRSPERGAATVVWLATAPELRGSPVAITPTSGRCARTSRRTTVTRRGGCGR
ncbi:MAG: hypothetical protein U0531_14195 [Dehalococcoidia bacterium]